ncbi:MAG: hypothetical protein CME04_18120 [Gemmatimonadaceae bacterium]|nr:hypothetical protein [Gemmatimonadaceae bacterium]
MRAGQQAFREQRYPGAEASFTEALALARVDGAITGQLIALDGLAASHAVRGNLPPADSLYSRLLGLQRHRFEVDSLSGRMLVRTLGTLSEISLNRGLLDRADSLLNHILELDASGAIDLRPEEATLAFTMQGLGNVLAARGDVAGASVFHDRAAGLKLYAQGFSYYVGDKLERAEQAFRGAMQHQERVLGPDHDDLARSAHALGRLFDLQGRQREALSLYERAVRVYASAGSGRLGHAAALDDLAQALPDGSSRIDSLRQRAITLRNASSRVEVF